MEVYEPLDADFPGKEETEVTIDEMTGDILTLHLSTIQECVASYMTVFPAEPSPHTNFGT